MDPVIRPTSDNPARAPSENRILTVAFGTVGVIALLLALAFWVAPPLADRIQYSRTLGERRALEETPSKGELDSLNRGSARLAKIMLPTVVHIDTRRHDVRKESTIFGNRARAYESLGEASGVIVDPSGYIVTNSHVVAGADQIQVKVLGREAPFTATKVGIDEEVDLAVIKIDATDLPAASWADSKSLEVGEFVWAIGNPFGLDGSVSMGIISAKGRKLADQAGANGGTSEAHGEDFLQTDAAINPGNSGGPLVNLNGEIIGINTAIVGPTNQGIGFAIPSEIAKNVYQKLRDNQHTVTALNQQGYLGVNMQSVTPEVARFLGLNELSGAVITQVRSGSPAAKAGLNVADVIIAWDGRRVDDPLALSKLVAKTAVGETVQAKVIRRGQEQTINVTIEKRATPQD